MPADDRFGSAYLKSRVSSLARLVGQGHGQPRGCNITTDDIEQQVVQFIRGLRPSNAYVDASTDLITSGLFDLLTLLELIEFVSKRFSVEIPASERNPANLRTPSAVTTLIKA